MAHDSRAIDLAHLLVARGLLTADQLAEAEEIHRGILATGVKIELEEVLVRKGFLTSQQLGEARSSIGKGRTDIIQGYEIISKIGQGGMGSVYKAKQLSIGRLVAIKILNPGFAQDRGAVERFLHESKAVAKMQHPNLVAGIDAGYQSGLYYYVMDYVEGRTLTRTLNARCPLPWREAISIARQIASALGHAASRSIVHRDVKPDNIIIDADGVAKLMDLGLARNPSGKHTTQQAAGVVAGTPMYMSPEQAMGRDDIDSRSDLYSLGLTLFETLCGHAPFDGKTPLVLLSQRLTERPRYELLSGEARVPDAAISIVKKMTARDREQRYASAETLIEDFDAALGGRPLIHAIRTPSRQTRIIPPGARPRRSSSPAAAIAVALVVAGLVLLGVVLSSSPAPRRPPPAPQAKGPEPPLLPAPPPPSKPPAPKPDESEGAWAAALAYETAGHPEEVLLNFVRVKEKLRGTPRIVEAEKKVVEWKSRVEEAVRTERVRLEGLAAGERFGEILAELQRSEDRFARAELRAMADMPEYAGWPAAWEKIRRGVVDRREAATQPARERAQALAREGRFDEAISELRKLGEHGEDVSAEIARIEAERKRRADEADRALLEELKWIEEAWAEAVRRAGSRNYAGAVQTFRELRARLGQPRSIRDAEEILADLERAASAAADPAAARKAAKAADARRGLFLFALFEGDAAAAEKELQMLRQAGGSIRPEYEAMYDRAEKVAARKREAAELIQAADRKFARPQTRGEALKEYAEILQQFASVLPEHTLAYLKQKLAAPKPEPDPPPAPPGPAPGAGDVVVEPAQMKILGKVMRGTHPRAPSKNVVVLDSDGSRREENCAEISFEAKAGETYKLWLLVGFFGTEANSVTVSLEDDVDAEGLVGEAISKTSYVVQYHPKSQEFGFGWTDRDMSVDGETIDLSRVVGPTFRYKTGGVKRIRIYNREKGTLVARALISSDRHLKQVPR
jgi:serine/threonine-protein kinase